MQDFDFDGFKLDKVAKYDLASIRSEAIGASGVPELYYFKDGVGRAECTRLAFHAGGVKFNETDYDVTKFGEVLSDTTSPPSIMLGTIPSMPCLFHGDSVRLALSTCTAEYAAELGMRRKRKPTAVERSLDAMVVATVRDMHEVMYPAAASPTEKIRAKLCEALPDELKPSLDGLERLFGRYAGPFLYSTQGPTLGDLALFDVITSSLPGLLQLGISLKPYPRLRACAHAVQETKDNSTLKKYLEERTSERGIARFALDAVPDSSAGGTLPDTTDKEVELIYFDGVGRGQLMRYLLLAGGIKFKDTRVSTSEWQKRKQDTSSGPGMMFGQMPVLVHGDHTLAQSLAIAAYIADIGINKASPPLPFERAMDYCVHGAVESIRREMYKVAFAPEGKGKQAAAKACGYEIAPTLAAIERMYEVNTHTPFLYRSVDVGPSLADIALLDLVFSQFPGIIRLGVAEIGSYQRILHCCHWVSIGDKYPALGEQLKEDLAWVGQQ